MTIFFVIHLIARYCCRYHGWQFDSDGKVTSIPQLEETKSVESIQKGRGNVQTFPVHPVGDLLFVFLPSSLHGEMFPQSILPEEHYPLLTGEEKVQHFVRELPYSFDFLVENLMDPAHIPYAHHKLQSTRDDGSPIVMKQMLSNFTTVEVSFSDKTLNRTRDAYASFHRPSFFHYGEYSGEGIDEPTGKKSRVPQLEIFCVPVSAGKSRVLFTFSFSDSVKIPHFLDHAGLNRFLNSDVWLHDTEREVVRRKDAGLAEKKLVGMDYISASMSDTGMTSFRKWWQDNGMADAPAHTFSMATMKLLGPTRLDRSEQIDPWENHVKHCSTCRTALKRMKKMQGVCLLMALLSTILSRRAPILGIVGAGSSLLARNLVKRFATALEGNPERSKIDDRSTSALAD